MYKSIVTQSRRTIKCGTAKHNLRVNVFHFFYSCECFLPFQSRKAKKKRGNFSPLSNMHSFPTSRNPRKIFVRNVSREATSDDLYKLMEKVGKVGKVEFKGEFAFIEFLDARDAEEAMGLFYVSQQFFSHFAGSFLCHFPPKRNIAQKPRFFFFFKQKKKKRHERGKHDVRICDK
ncbi:hypothetical protein RFI_10562 [Reticulomyxa filosa]|uniref:RRM domain-containing protein n=1 Tax=Reticulomyxa filosa TaxID=46433 RepID=X6NJU0_RETFI|nr:hypothetical protein RFI_10562 [Reticulomyxa filosa]|eukprot:ETO26575.1 hypothetical protein RFI_10562 [Reticulomyxa filosa]